MSTTIDPGQRVVTLINTFTVEPEHQDELVRVLVDATEEVIRHVPGFVSANIHRGLAGRHVANYAQWESRDAFEAMLRDPTARAHMDRAAALAQYEPLLYEVVETIGG